MKTSLRFPEVKIAFKYLFAVSLIAGCTGMPATPTRSPVQLPTPNSSPIPGLESTPQNLPAPSQPGADAAPSHDDIVKAVPDVSYSGSCASISAFGINICIPKIGGASKDVAPARVISTVTNSLVPVFYATDRNMAPVAKDSVQFGVGRGGLTYGYCQVSVPVSHKSGNLESPSKLRFEFREDPDKHIILVQTVPMTKDNFFKELASRVSSSKGKKAFIFVHGYNVSFEDAARRTAQISYDLGFDGAPVFYSWPSQGGLQQYTVDEQNVEWTEAHLRSFLVDFFARTNANNIYLIAHSMGNRALARVIVSLLEQFPDVRTRLKEIILTAPDIDAEVFQRDIAPKISGASPRVTLYASSKDKALVASKALHGYPRAGDAGERLVVIQGIETVDASNVDTSFLGHSYYSEERSVLSDMYYLINDGKNAEERFGLRHVDNKAGRHWEFKP